MANIVYPNTFLANTTARASEVNANFTAVATQVNGNIEGANLAANAVTTAKILDASVTDVKVATGINAAKIADGTVSDTEFQYLNGVTSPIQTQLSAVGVAYKGIVIDPDSVFDTPSGINDTFHSPAIATTLPAGWSVELPVASLDTEYTLTHNLGTTSYTIFLTPFAQNASNSEIPTSLDVLQRSANTCKILARTSAAAAEQRLSFMFVLMPF